MKIEVHVLTSDYSWILPWSLRHYCALADRVVVHDGGPSCVMGRDMAGVFGAEWREWDTAGQLNDDLARKLKNSCWRDTDADWVACVDDDELLWWPAATPEAEKIPSHRTNARYALESYERLGAAVVKPHGFEMFSECLPEPLSGQIWEQIPSGAPDDKWYAKPVLFSPRRVSDTGFGVGAHEARVVTKSGVTLNVDKEWPKAKPPVYLLHYHQIGSAEFVAARYDATRRRLSAVNERNRWGNFDAGAVHVEHKRGLILPNLRRVVS